MNCRVIIRSIAHIEGVPVQQQLQLHRIADRLNGKCSLDDAVRVAYIVYRLLRPAQVSH
jgi:hypothetical protein